MDYIELNITSIRDIDPEIILAQLAELGFESFSESENILQGYVREDVYDEQAVASYLASLKVSHDLEFAFQRIPEQNWNALWESAYEPVTIRGKCQVRAPFHPPVPGIEYDLVIEPRMSFGTAHHETTSLMLELMMEEEIAGKDVLDMGCGTGVLAILAFKMQAARVVAIDNDEWAFSNALDNVAVNGAAAIRVIRGEVDGILLPGYDLIVANINRNVLLKDIPGYSGFLNGKGVLLLSGFYEQDLEMISEVAAGAGLHYVTHKSANHWVGARFMK